MSLSKAKAKIESINNTKTWGELLCMVVNSEGARPHSVLNSSMSLDTSLGVMKDFIKEKDAAKVPDTIRCDKGTLSVSGVIVMNIYRECH